MGDGKLYRQIKLLSVCNNHSLFRAYSELLIVDSQTVWLSPGRNWNRYFTRSFCVLQTVRYQYFHFASAILKMREHGRQHFSVLIYGEQHSKLLYLWKLCVFIIGFHLCSGKICFSRLTEFTEPYRKPEVDIMTLSFVAKAQLVSDNFTETTHFHNCPLITGKILQKKHTHWGMKW